MVTLVTIGCFRWFRVCVTGDGWVSFGFPGGWVWGLSLVPYVFLGFGFSSFFGFCDCTLGILVESVT